jgi:nitrogen fixation NifU-like protein
MSTELRDLYTDSLLDHSRSKRNTRTLSTPPAASSEGDNPLCGDRVTCYVRVRDGVVEDACYQGAGCAISLASASMACDAMRGHTVQHARAIADGFIAHLLGADFDASLLPCELSALSGVRIFPMRVKCATLPWHALRDALRLQEEAKA